MKEAPPEPNAHSLLGLSCAATTSAVPLRPMAGVSKGSCISATSTSAQNVSEILARGCPHGTEHSQNGFS